MGSRDLSQAGVDVERLTPLGTTAAKLDEADRLLPLTFPMENLSNCHPASKQPSKIDSVTRLDRDVELGGEIQCETGAVHES